MESQTAREPYTCNAFEAIWFGGLDSIAYTAEELAQIETVKAQNGKILPGQRYFEVVYMYDGDECRYRALPAMHAICDKYDLLRGD